MAPAYLRDHGLNKPECTLPENAFTQAFSGQMVSEKIFEKYQQIFNNIQLSEKIDPQLWFHPIPRDHDFNKHESTPNEDASTDDTCFLAK